MFLSDFSFGTLLQDVSSKFLGALPNVIGALVVLVIGWIIATLVSKGVRKMLEKVKIDKLTDNLNQIDLFSKMSLNIKPSFILSKLVYYLLFFVFLIAATDLLKMPAVSELMSDLINYFPKLLSALLLFIIGLVVCDFIRQIIKTACDSVGVPSGKIISDFIFYFLFITVVMSALKQAGVATEFMTQNLTLIIGGIVVAFAVSYGIASWRVTSSLLSSFFTKKKINVGEVIKIKDLKGEVMEMDSTSVTILTEEGRKIIIPMSRFMESEVEIYD